MSYRYILHLAEYIVCCEDTLNAGVNALTSV